MQKAEQKKGVFAVLAVLVYQKTRSVCVSTSFPPLAACLASAGGSGRLKQKAWCWNVNLFRARTVFEPTGPGFRFPAALYGMPTVIPGTPFRQCQKSRGCPRCRPNDSRLY